MMFTCLLRVSKKNDAPSDRIEGYHIPMEFTSRELLTHLYQTATDAVDGRHLVFQWCASNTMPFKHCLAVGKAAPAMLQGALDSNSLINNALLICKKGQASRSLRKNKNVAIAESAHPVPDQSSLDAGRHLLRFLAAIPEGEKLLVLISGGASSLVEVLAGDLTLDDLQKINNHLLASGKDIYAMNAWRQKISQIKGGSLLAHVNPGNCTQLLISDVQGDDPSIIGSGLLVASGAIVDDDPWLGERYMDVNMDISQHDAIDTHIIGTLDMAMQAIKLEVENMNVDCYVHDESLDGDAIEKGEAIGQWLCTAPSGVHVWGGETTMQLPDKPGLGGRNQTFALSAARMIEDEEDIGILAAGTDGIDGNTACAGASVYSSTMRAARQCGFDVDAELRNANAGTVLMATTDIFKPGPTNTNVMDLVIAYKR
jgi:hydroxypyruvate reductase